ncbi:MAG: hypothetical protein AAB534_01805 [Patescibacteria group bacterium]
MEKDLIKKHHAFLYISEDENALLILTDFLKTNLDFDINSNLDYWQKDTDTFGIDESRELKNRHLSKALGESGRKVFVVRTKFITNEAQNALLKILEEPQPNSFFFFILPSSENLLPTLMSRFMPIKRMADRPKREKSVAAPFEMDYFLSLSIPARIRLLAQIIEDKDKGEAKKFLNHLEVALRKKVKLKEISDEQVNAFEIISKSRNYLNNRSASVKIILENVAMVIPRV